MSVKSLYFKLKVLFGLDTLDPYVDYMVLKC